MAGEALSDCTSEQGGCGDFIGGFRDLDSLFRQLAALRPLEARQGEPRSPRVSTRNSTRKIPMSGCPTAQFHLVGLIGSTWTRELGQWTLSKACSSQSGEHMDTAERRTFLRGLLGGFALAATHCAHCQDFFPQSSQKPKSRTSPSTASGDGSIFPQSTKNRGRSRSSLESSIACADFSSFDNASGMQAGISRQSGIPWLDQCAVARALRDDVGLQLDASLLLLQRAWRQ